MFKHLVFAVLASALASAPAHANEDAEAEAREAVFAEYQAILDAQIEAGVPGVSVFIRVGREAWTGTAGLADIETARPVTPETAFRTASITKLFTAVLITDLIRAGRLSYDDTLDELLPGEIITGLPNVERITLANLLAHETGLTNFTDLDSYFEFRWNVADNRTRLIEPMELLDLVRGREARAEPGTQFEYCNTCYVLLGLIAEHSEGQPLAELFDSRIFQPFGMDQTYLSGYQNARTPVASSYAGVSEAGIRSGVIRDDMPRLTSGPATLVNLSAEGPRTYNAWAFSAGGIDSTPRDLGRLVTAIINEDASPWPPALQQEALAYPRGVDWNGGSWGIAASALMIAPRDTVVVMFVNGVPTNWDRMAAFNALADLAEARADVLDAPPARDTVGDD